MSQSLTRLFKLSALAAAFGLTVGCATTDAQLQASVEEARQEAAAAHSLATEARAEAAAAMEAANEAREMASNAEGLAQAAQFSADRAVERQERMIQRGMYK